MSRIEREKTNTRTILIALVTLLAMTAVMSTLAEETPYRFTRGFPADETTIKQAQDATDLRRAIEAYKFFFPTVATEAVIQQFEPHGAIPNKVGIIMPQDPEQQFSVANQDTPYVISVFDLKDGPEKPVFDGFYKLPDIEELK